MIQGIIGLGSQGGIGFQLFKKTTDNTDAIFATSTERDTYFSANPGDLATLNTDQFKIIKLLDNGSGEVAYQQREFTGSVYMWKDVTSLVTGPTGSAANLEGVSVGHIPVKSQDGVSFGDSGMRLEGGRLITSMDIVGNEVISSLNSFKLADQHTVSSGAENVFFTNNTRNIHFFPTWQGQTAYDWSNNSNEVVRATERVYGDIVQFTLGSENLAGPAIPLTGTRTTTTNISYYGIKFRIKEDYTGKLTYSSTNIPTGVVLFETIQDVAAVDGDMVEIRFSDVDGANAPLELQSGEELSRSVTKEDGTPVLTTASDVGADVNYLEFPFRNFSDQRLALLSDINYSAPVITSLIVRNQPTQVDDGTVVSGSKNVDFTISNGSNIDGTLTLTVDGTEVLAGIDPSLGTASFTYPSTTLTSGTSTSVVLTGTDTRGSSISATFTIRARVQTEALYYGVVTDITPANIDESVLTEYDILSGTTIQAVFTVPANSYAVIVSPDDKDIVDIENTLVNTGNVLNDFVKTDNVITINSVQYDLYTHQNLASITGDLNLSIRIG